MGWNEYKNKEAVSKVNEQPLFFVWYSMEVYKSIRSLLQNVGVMMVMGRSGWLILVFSLFSRF